MKYVVRLTKPTQKALDSLDGAIFNRIVDALHGLEDNPRPFGVVKMAGEENQWRVRVGDWRIIYSILDRELVVLVVKLGHRREIYR